MFNIDETPIFRHQVKVSPPGGAKQDFWATFEALGVEEFNSFDLSSTDQTKAFIERVLQSVEDIVGNDRQPVPDSVELRARLINMSWVRQGLVRAYLEGHREGQAGN